MKAALVLLSATALLGVVASFLFPPAGFLVLIGVGLPFYFLYWHLFRPVVLTRLNYKTFKVRDELRMMVANGAVGEKDKAFPILDRACNHCIARTDRFDVTDVIATALTTQEKLEAERDLAIIRDSSPELRRIHRELIVATVGAAFANSPGVLLALAPFVVLAVVVFWFDRVKVLLTRIMTHTWGIMNLRSVFATHTTSPINDLAFLHRRYTVSDTSVSPIPISRIQPGSVERIDPSGRKD
jgi:hypothetical protein